MYDLELHVSVPTLDYFKANTGIDLVLEKGSKELADGQVRSLTAKARDYLFMDKPYETQRIISYLIKTNKEWEATWLTYVVRYIEATLFYGDESNWDKTPKPILNAVYGSALKINEFSASIRLEVKYTTEVF